jgi:nitric oxide reductase NorQ protein
MPSSLFAPKDVQYVDVFELMPLYEGLSFRAPTVAVGPKGIGKTLSFQSFAYANNCPIITYDCSEDVRRSHLIGMQVLRGDQTPFILGPLTTVFEVANEVGKCILCMEEINALTPQMQKVLNAATDWRARIEVPELQKVFTLEKGAKVWIVGTMNSAVYGGVHQLNEDLKSRLRLIALNYPKTKDEEAIIEATLKGISKKLPPKTVERVLLLAHETRQKALEYALSTRDVVQILDDMAILGIPNACRIVLGKFEGADRDTVEERLGSLFGTAAKKKSA